MLIFMYPILLHIISYIHILFLFREFTEEKLCRLETLKRKWSKPSKMWCLLILTYFNVIGNANKKYTFEIARTKTRPITCSSTLDPKCSETDIYVIKRGSTCVPRIVWTDPSCIDLWDYKL